MKKWIAVTVALAGILSPAFGQSVTDDFETGQTPGSPPVGWDQTFDTNAVPPQLNLVTVESGVGRDGGQGLSFQVTQTLANYAVVKTNGLNSTKLKLSADVRVTITADPLSNPPANVNSPVIGLGVKTSPIWWEGPLATLPLCRRDDNSWGFRIPTAPFVEGNVANVLLGLPANGLVAATSDWFTLEMELTDSGSGWSATTALVDGNGTTLLTTTPQQLAAIPTGSTLYGTLTTSYNEGGIVTNKAAVSKIDKLYADNLSLETSSIAVSAITIADVAGYSFTSVVARTHSLQYSLDGTNYVDTGAYVNGDGTVKTLFDPAVDTSGRTYRVSAPSELTATFDWSEVAVGASWWLGYGYVETNNGVVMVSSGRAASHGGGDGVGGVGFALKAAYSQDVEAAYFNILQAGVTQQFTATSIDIAANAGNPAELTPSVQGTLDGVVKWSILPPSTSAFNTYTEATAGNMQSLIDQIVWNTGQHSNPNATFNNSLDNLVVAVGSPEFAAVSATMGKAVVVEAQRTGVADTTELRARANLATGQWVSVAGTLVEAGDGTARYVATDVGAPNNNYRVERRPPPYFTNFEDGAAGWTAVNNNPGVTTVWEWGPPNLSIPAQSVDITVAASGLSCWGTDLDSTYADDTDTTLISPPISLANSAAATLEWMERRDIDETPAIGDDNGYVSIIDMDMGTTNVVHTSQGANSAWQLVSVPIPASALGHTIRIAFRLAEENDSTSGWGGWYIDDVAVRD